MFRYLLDINLNSKSTRCQPPILLESILGIAYSARFRYIPRGGNRTEFVHRALCFQ